MNLIVQATPVEPIQRVFVFRGITLTFTGSRLKLATSIPDDSEIPFVSPTTGKDARGLDTPLKGTIAVTVSDPKVVEIVQPDPLTPTATGSGVIRPVGLGNAQVIFTDTGDGSSPMTVIVEVEVVGGAVTTVNPPVLGNLRPINSSPAANPG